MCIRICVPYKYICIKGTIAYITYKVFLFSFSLPIGLKMFPLSWKFALLFLFFPRHAYQLALIEFCTEKGSRINAKRRCRYLTIYCQLCAWFKESAASQNKQYFHPWEKVTVPSSVFLLPHTSHCLWRFSRHHTDRKEFLQPPDISSSFKNRTEWNWGICECLKESQVVK